MMPFLEIGALRVPMYPLAYSVAFALFATLVLPQLGRLPDGKKYQQGAVLILAIALIRLYLPGWVEEQVRALITGQPAAAPVMRVYYGVGLGILIVAVYCRARRLSIWLALDRSLPYFALSYAIARLGCLAWGCCGGAETTSALGMYMPDDQGHWANRYPTQLMSFGVQLALFVFFYFQLHGLPGRRAGGPAPQTWASTPGLISLTYLLAFCLERFALDFLRFDYRPIWGPLSLAQIWMLAGMLAIAFGLLKIRSAARARASLA